MRFLIISKTGASAPLATRLENEGHHTTYYINDKNYHKLGAGILKKSKCLDPLITTTNSEPNDYSREALYAIVREASPDIIVFDTTGFGKVSEDLRRKGFKTVGGALVADLLEHNKEFGSKLMQTTKIKTLPAPDVSTVNSLNDNAISVTVSGWFNGNRFIDPSYITFTDKHFMPGDKHHSEGLGPEVECAACVTHYFNKTRPKIFKYTLERIESLLRKSSYRGPINLNTIVSDTDVYGVDWCARFSYDSLWTLLEGLRMRVSDLLVGVASGTISRMNVGSDPTVALRVTTTPYPNEPNRRQVPLTRGFLGVTPENKDHIFLVDVKKGSVGLEVAGTNGNVCCVTAHGQDSSHAIRRILKTCKELKVKDMQFRADGGQRAKRDFKRLLGWGWV